jgi:hypothetical protein
MYQDVNDLRELRTPEAYQARIVFLCYKADALELFEGKRGMTHVDNLRRKATNLLHEARWKFPECTFVLPKSLPEIQQVYMGRVWAKGDSA